MQTPLYSRNITYFLKTANATSFNSAARSIGVTQSSLSVAIQNLEQDLEIQLFERSVKGIQLTREGRILLEQITSHQEALDQHLRMALRADSPLNLKIGARPAFFQKYLMPLYLQKPKEFARSKFFIRSSLEMYQAVEDSRLDFAFIASPIEPKGQLGFIFIKAQQGAWLANKVKFRHLKKARSYQDLVGEPLLHDPYGQEPTWASMLDDHPQGFSVPDVAILKQLILDGVGISETEPDIFTIEEMRKLLVLNIPTQFPNGAIYLVYRKSTSSAHRQAIEQYVTALESSVAKTQVLI